MSSDEEEPEFDSYEIPKVEIPADLIARFQISNNPCVRREPVLAVETVSTLANSTYEFLCKLCSFRFNHYRLQDIISDESFERVWRYLLLRRAQDVHFKIKGKGSDSYRKNFPALGMMVPAPLADLLYSYGQYESVALGYLICPSAPAPPARNIPNWYQLDHVVIKEWITACSLLSSVYEMKVFPSCNQYTGTAIMLTSRTIGNDRDTVNIRSPTREPTLSDVYLRVVNEDLFENNPFHFDRLGFLNATGVSLAQLRTQYICNYTKT